MALSSTMSDCVVVAVLQGLDLSGCQSLTDAGIAAVARHCPGLRAIDVSSGFELTDAAFSSLAACRQLRTVNACGCDRLSDAGLCALVRGTRSALSVSSTRAPWLRCLSWPLRMRGREQALHSREVNFGGRLNAAKERFSSANRRLQRESW